MRLKKPWKEVTAAPVDRPTELQSELEAFYGTIAKDQGSTLNTVAASFGALSGPTGGMVSSSSAPSSSSAANAAAKLRPPAIDAASRDTIFNLLAELSTALNKDSTHFLPMLPTPKRRNAAASGRKEEEEDAGSGGRGKGGKQSRVGLFVSTVGAATDEDGENGEDASKGGAAAGDVDASGEPVYCVCRGPSHGNMVACDNDACEVSKRDYDDDDCHGVHFLYCVVYLRW